MQLQQQKHLELDEDPGLYPQWPISISFTAGLPEASQSSLSPVTSNNGHKTFYCNKRFSNTCVGGS